MPCPTCRLSATWCWPGSGSTSRSARSRATRPTPRATGGAGAADYFFNYELPKIGAWLECGGKPRSDMRSTLPEEAF